jgi:hypothetical protein
VGRIVVYIEAGKRRVFAGAVEWPGWARSGPDEDAALEALLAYAPRYARAVRKAAGGFAAPSDVSAFVVAERLKGDATTDFGAPGIAPAADQRKLGGKETARQQALLKAAWSALDSAARAAVGARLRKGPRGGGRDLDAIVAHVLEADKAYLRSLGGRFSSEPGEKPEQERRRFRRQLLDTIAARAGGEPAPPSPRRKKPPWTPRYTVRRSAWHALDHAWEIQDRV